MRTLIMIHEATSSRRYVQENGPFPLLPFFFFFCFSVFGGSAVKSDCLTVKLSLVQARETTRSNKEHAAPEHENATKCPCLFQKKSYLGPTRKSSVKKQKDLDKVLIVIIWRR